MSSLAGVWPALQSIGIVGILLVVLVAVSRGAYIPRAAHDETLAAVLEAQKEFQREIVRLEAEVSRLQSALAARQGDDD